jgi:hypothetical protein
MNQTRLLALLIIVGGILLFCVSLARADVTISLAWDYENPPPDLDGFILYWSNESGVYDILNQDAQKNVTTSTLRATSVTLTDGTWYFVLVAYNTTGTKSDFSNEAVSIGETPGLVPPQNLRIISTTVVTIESDTVVRVGQ